MASLNDLIDKPLQWYYAAFTWAPGVGLALISALAGVGMLWVFRMTSDLPRIRRAKRYVMAHLIELRVFRDEPGVMWSAQKSLLGANLRYLGLMLRPALWMAIPLTLLLVHLDPFYGWAPLQIGEQSILTVSLRPPVNPDSPPPQLIAPAGLAVETPGVRIPAEHQVSWRVRPVAPVSANARLIVAGETVEKRIEAGPGARYVPGRSVHSALAAVWHPGEPRIQAPGVEWIDVRYSKSDVFMFGVRLHWLVWFTLISMAAALLLKRRFRVVL